MLRVLSLGAGVQSSTLALLAATGEVGPPLDAAIFADTHSEPAAVYKHLAWLQTPGLLPFPIYVVSAGNLGELILQATRGESKRGSHARPPVYVKKPDGTRGIVRRQCTGDFKIDPIEKQIRTMLGLKPRQHWPKEVAVEQWFGISRDETQRMRDSQNPAIENRYPLVELGMTRQNCLEWMARKGYPTPPRSACVFCPFHNDRSWRTLKDTDPKAFADAVAIDEAIRTGLQEQALSGELYLHGKLIPLREVDLSTAEERGQPDLFSGECGGHCGV